MRESRRDVARTLCRSTKTRIPTPRPADLHRHTARSHGTAGSLRRSHLCRRGLEPQCPRGRTVESRARARRLDAVAAARSGRRTHRRWRSAHLDKRKQVQSVPNVQYRYRVYRRDESSGKDAIAGEVPIPVPGPSGRKPGPAHFTDSALEWEKTYLYRVTAVTIVKRPDSEVQVEGDDTPPVRVIAHDVFPPSVPAGLQAAFSGEGQKPFIDLIWAASNRRPRQVQRLRSKADATAIQLNSELVKAPSYRDSAVASGKTYTYQVSAVDVRGNESQRSEKASEPVP